MTKDRDSKGRFTDGNPGGPGRPRRAVERDYLVAFVEIASPDRFRLIAERAVADAIAGDSAARNWVTRYLLGDPAPAKLLEIAADELRGQTVEDDIHRLANRRALDAFAETSLDLVERGR